MKNIQTKVYSCRLNAEQIRQAEMIAVHDGDANIGALMKRLLIERITNSNNASKKSLDESSKHLSSGEQFEQKNQIAAITNLRELVSIGFEILFEATNTIENYQIKKNLIDKNWDEITGDFSHQPQLFLTAVEESQLANIDNSEIDFDDIFSNETFIQISENFSAETNTSNAQ